MSIIRSLRYNNFSFFYLISVTINLCKNVLHLYKILLMSPFAMDNYNCVSFVITLCQVFDDLMFVVFDLNVALFVL